MRSLKKHKTAGEYSLQASQDQTIYDSLEAGHALTEDMAEQLSQCVQVHDDIFNEPEYFVVMQLASDPLLHNVMRRKFYGDIYLPDPRPRQTVFLWSKTQQKFLKRLWVLPDVVAMETLYEITNVDPAYLSMKKWSEAFYNGNFWNTIRAQHGISHLSKSEYLNVHRAEIIKAAGNKIEVLRPNPFDFSKVAVQKVIDKFEPILN